MEIRAHVRVLCCLVLLGVAFAGCSKEWSNPTGPGAHPGSWLDTTSANFHGAKVAREGDRLCSSCHAVTTSATDKHAVALSCANTDGCHASAEGPQELNCESCHQTLGGAHVAHFSTGVSNCAACHAMTVDASAALSDSAHMDGQIEVSMNTLYGGTYSSSDGTCQGTYCHGATATTPTWTSSTHFDCNSCHPTATLPGAHAKHLLMTNNRCDVCHDATATESGTLRPDAPHLNRAVDVVMYPPFTSLIYNPTTATCSQGEFCHTGVSKPWKQQ